MKKFLFGIGVVIVLSFTYFMVYEINLSYREDLECERLGGISVSRDRNIHSMCFNKDALIHIDREKLK